MSSSKKAKAMELLMWVVVVAFATAGAMAGDWLLIIPMVISMPLALYFRDLRHLEFAKEALADLTQVSLKVIDEQMEENSALMMELNQLKAEGRYTRAEESFGTTG